MISMYTSFYLFGVGEVCPKTPIENWLAIILLVLSCSFNGYIIGNMALYLIELEKNNTEFQRKLDTANTAMMSLELNN